MQGTSGVLNADPQSDTRTYGRYQVTAQITVDGGYSINVMTATGGARLPELCFSTPDRDTYRTVYAVIREGGIHNVHPDGVRDAIRDALTLDLAAMQRRRDTPSTGRIEHINRLLDDLDTPADRAALSELADRLTRSLADTVPTGRHPQVVRSRSGIVERQPLTGPQQRLINRHEGGIIRAGRGVAWTTLQSIARKGYADVIARSGQKITAIRLNKQGYAAVKAVA